MSASSKNMQNTLTKSLRFLKRKNTK